MNDNFDPFGGNSSRYYEGARKNKPKNNSVITIILIIALIGLGVYYGYSYLPIGKTNLKFNVINTEGETVTANIRIAKDSMFTKKVISFQSGLNQKVKKGTYYYSVQASGYTSITSKEIKIKEDSTNEIILEKAIPLTINSIVFPEKVFVGQEVTLNIYYKNTSDSKVYTIDDIVIKGAIKDWEYRYVDGYDDTISKEQVVLSPKTESIIYIKYKVQDTGKSNNNIEVRVKYKEKSSNTKFEIIPEPEIPIKGNISGELKSGESKNFTVTIENSKNKIAITDLTLDLDVSGNNNQNVLEWFTYEKGNIVIEGRKNITKSLALTVPQTAVDDIIEGSLIFNSSIFREPQKLPIKLVIKEPNIDFTIGLTKNNVKLEYDINNQTTNTEYVSLKLNNKSTIDIEVLDIKTVNLGLVEDCNELIYISNNALSNNKIMRNTTPEIIMTITARPPFKVDDLINNTRACSIVVSYKHPFRSGETLSVGSNLVIKIE